MVFAMQKFLTILLLTFGLVLSIFAKPHGFDDEGEISVPRSPKIEGPQVVTLPYKNLTKDATLQCDIEGTPTPKVIWLKDGQEIRNDEGPYTTIFDAKEGIAKLNFKDSDADEKDTKHRTGNFTCMAANFLGQVQKLFLIAVEEEDVSTTSTNILSHPVPAGGNNTIPEEDVTPTTAQQTSTGNKDDSISHTDTADAISTTSAANADLGLTSLSSSSSPTISRNSSDDVTSTNVRASKR